MGLSGGGVVASIIRGGWGLAVYNAPNALEHMFEKLSVINSGLAKRRTTIYCVSRHRHHYILFSALFRADLSPVVLPLLVDSMQI